MKIRAHRSLPSLPQLGSLVLGVVLLATPVTGLSFTMWSDGSEKFPDESHGGFASMRGEWDSIAVAICTQASVGCETGVTLNVRGYTSSGDNSIHDCKDSIIANCLWERTNGGTDSSVVQFTCSGCKECPDHKGAVCSRPNTITSTTVSTTTPTTITTYNPQRCHGVSEPVGCGSRIPTGDCFVGGEHQLFAEQTCPAMCGLACSSTTTTMTSTTTTTTTTTTATITTTSATTVTTFTSTTVLMLNAQCNPRDDRCDAQEGLACDSEHNECRHKEVVTIPPYLTAEVDRLIKDAVRASDAALTATIHKNEMDMVMLGANLTVCKGKLEARRLARLAQTTEDLGKLASSDDSGAAVDASTSTGGDSNAVGLAVGLALGIALLATISNVAIRYYGSQEHDDGTGSNNVQAFTNPLYATGVDQVPAAAALPNGSDTYDDVAGSVFNQEMVDETSYGPADEMYEDVAGGSANA